MKYQLSYNHATQIATVQPEGYDIPSGSTKIGDFIYDPVTPDKTPPLGADVSHTLYHEVKELLFHQNITNMSLVQISLDDAPVWEGAAGVKFNGEPHYTNDPTLGSWGVNTLEIIPTNPGSVPSTSSFSTDREDLITITQTGPLTAIIETNSIFGSELITIDIYLNEEVYTMDIQFPPA